MAASSRPATPATPSSRLATRAAASQRADAGAGLAGGRCVAGALRRATRAITRHYDEHLAPSGLTISRFSLLSTLERMGTTTLAAYARDLAMDRTTLLRNLRALMDDGLIAVEPAPGGRAKTARITGRGAAALRRARPYWHEAQNALAGRVDRDDVDRILAVATKLSG